MKGIMLSVKPRYCKLITSGEKTIEVRKTSPKISAPFKCYIYCTKENMGNNPKQIWWHKDTTGFAHIMNGKVIGEFLCKTIIPILIEYSDPQSRIALREFPLTGITDKEIIDYLGNGKQGFGWHISDFIIYDEPKKLGDFALKRPPQSWCYIEGEKI